MDNIDNILKKIDKYEKKIKNTNDENHKKLYNEKINEYNTMINNSLINGNIKLNDNILKGGTVNTANSTDTTLKLKNYCKTANESYKIIQGFANNLRDINESIKVTYTIESNINDKEFIKVLIEIIYNTNIIFY